MKNKLNVSFVFLFLLLLSSAGLTSAFIVEHHTRIGDEAISNTLNSPITQEILPYKDYYQMCNVLVDISVVDYFTIEQEEGDNFIDSIFNVFRFSIGAKYKGTHSQLACLRALEVAETPKERACGYGICSHLVGADSVSHNLYVPGVIEKTNLFNGLVHSIGEISIKNKFTDISDRVYSRQILDLGYEMTPYFEKVFVQDPSLSKVSIPAMIDFFIVQVQQDNSGGYRLGFRSFFALPTYLYWMILIFFLLSLALLGLTIRKIRDSEFNILTGFTLLVAIALISFISIAIFGLISGNVWAMWEVLSQFLFSPAMYLIGGFLIFLSLVLIFKFFQSKTKKQDIPNILVALFILSFGVLFLTFPGGLTLGNEQFLHDLAVSNTEQLLTQGAGFVRQIPDPVGFIALKEANEHGETSRTLFMLYTLALLVSIIFFTFKPKKFLNQ